MKNLKKQRQRIDAIDAKIISLLQKRCKTTNAIFELKKNVGQKTVDKQREKIIYEKFYEELKGLSTKRKIHFFVEALLKINKNYPQK